MKLIRQQGRIFVAALPQESVIANMAKRVLKLIREEYDALQAVNAKHTYLYHRRHQIIHLSFNRSKFVMIRKQLYHCTSW